MANTFVFRSGAVDPAPLQDGLVAILNNHPDPKACIDIRRIRLLPVGGQAITGCGTYTLDRISAISGGEDIAYSKHDTDSADLPAEVIIRSIPESVTITSTLRRIGELPMFSSTLSGYCLARVQSAARGSAKTQSDDLIRFPTSADVERIILREGEGIAIVQDAFSVPHGGAAGFCIRETTSGACYTVRSRDVRTRGTADSPHIAVFNDSGSGVVLEIFNIQYPEEGEYDMPHIRIAKIDGVEGGVDASADILSLDTEKTLPSTINVFEGPFRAKLAGEDSGVPYDWHTRHGIDGYNIRRQFRSGVVRTISMPVISTDAGSTLLYSLQNALVWAAYGANSGIILRPGEGIAVLSGREMLSDAASINNSTMNCYQAEITFNYISPPQSQRAGLNLGA